MADSTKKEMNACREGMIASQDNLASAITMMNLMDPKAAAAVAEISKVEAAKPQNAPTQPPPHAAAPANHLPTVVEEEKDEPLNGEESELRGLLLDLTERVDCWLCVEIMSEQMSRIAESMGELQRVARFQRALLHSEKALLEYGRLLRLREMLAEYKQELKGLRQEEQAQTDPWIREMKAVKGDSCEAHRIKPTEKEIAELGSRAEENGKAAWTLLKELFTPLPADLKASIGNLSDVLLNDKKRQHAINLLVERRQNIHKDLVDEDKHLHESIDRAKYVYALLFSHIFTYHHLPDSPPTKTPTFAHKSTI